MGIVRKGYELLDSSLDLLLPDVCRACGVLVEEPGKHQGICRSCLSEVKYLGINVCCRCGAPFTKGVRGGHHCSACLKRMPPYDRAVSISKYEGAVRKLLHRLKYRADTRVKPALSTITRMAGEVYPTNGDCIIPVPLYASRLRKRGLNQSLQLARILFPERRHLIQTASIERVRNTEPQTGLDGRARRENLRRAFRITDRDAVSGRNVLLVDDVFTTGTTVEECSRTLKKAGALRVDVVTFARVILKR